MEQDTDPDSLNQNFQQVTELKAGKELLQSVFDTSLIGISVLEALRDESGNILDFSIKIINKQLEKEAGRKDLVGKLYAKEFPGIKKVGLYDLMEKVMETGVPEKMEYYYNHESFSRWYSSMFVKMGDGLVATNRDITENKRTEQEKFKNFAILKKSEEIALMGSWEYDLETSVFIWSDGMYRLYGLKKGTKVTPEIYLKCATLNSQAMAERMVSALKAGTPDFEETLEITAGYAVKIIKIKSTVLYNETGKPLTVGGVDMDVSAQFSLQKEKNQLESQQQLFEATQNLKILQATLTAQEEERKRIAESLHNGLGQLLYGVKLSLEQLNFNKEPIDLKWLKEVKIATERLLTETIKESRRISHELTPTILEDFGLKEAINQICRQFSQGLQIDCELTGPHRNINKFIEITVYRTVQELVMNIIKHSKASRAFVKIKFNKKSIQLTVQDNGIGFNSPCTNDGIGLKTIRNKIKLLKGTFSLIYGMEKDTVIDIRIPIVQD